MVYDYIIEPAIATLESGGLILFPTDTVWGIGCDATNPAAVEKVYALKERDRTKPFVLLVSSISMLKDFVGFIHPRVQTLLGFHQRPLTIIYDEPKNLPENVLALDGTVAIRVVLDDFCKQLIERFGKPVIATAASIGDSPLPKHFGEISSAVIEGVNFVVKYRQMEKDMSQPSVIAKLSEEEELVFFRE